jgi:hypothetical protein
MVFGFGKKKKEETAEAEAPPVPEEEVGERFLPEDLEKFKLKGPFEEAMEKQPVPVQPLPRFSARTQPAEGKKEGDNEMVLARLDAIEARLKVVEEKLKRL